MQVQTKRNLKLALWDGLILWGCYHLFFVLSDLFFPALFLTHDLLLIPLYPAIIISFLPFLYLLTPIGVAAIVGILMVWLGVFKLHQIITKK